MVMLMIDRDASEMYFVAFGATFALFTSRTIISLQNKQLRATLYAVPSVITGSPGAPILPGAPMGPTSPYSSDDHLDGIK